MNQDSRHTHCWRAQSVESSVSVGKYGHESMMEQGQCYNNYAQMQATIVTAMSLSEAIGQ